MIAGVVKETYPDERRVALVPAVVPALSKARLQVHIQAGAGQPAGFVDAEFQAKGATIIPDRAGVLGSADILCQVHTAGTNPRQGRDDLSQLKPGAVVIGLADPLYDLGPLQTLASSGATVFALELMPRITR